MREQGIKECSAFQFSVRANNGIADSPEGTVIGGFPMGEYTKLHSVVCISSADVFTVLLQTLKSLRPFDHILQTSALVRLHSQEVANHM